MRNEDWQEFDRTIGSILADAEEPVPSGVWEAISGRLEAARKPVVVPFHARPVFWKRAAVGLAAAVVLAAGLFFAGTAGKQSPAGSTLLADASAQQQSEAPKISYEPFQELPVVEFDWSEPAPAHSQARPTVPATVQDQADPPITEEPLKEHVSDSPRQEEPRPAPSSSGSGQQAAPATTQPDPFALMAAEDSRKQRSSRRVAAIFSGGISGNDARDSRPAFGVAPGSAVASTQTSILEKSTSTYGAPVSFGLGLRWFCTQRFAVGLGIDYTLLTRSFSGVYTPASGLGATVEGDVRHTMQYLGIPLQLSYTLIDSGNIRFYTFGGGEIEFCASNRYALPDGDASIIYKERVKEPQFSLAGGIGVEFKVSDRIGLFIDPSVHYYFDCRQPKNVRTEKPLLINFNAGFRFNL